MDSRRNKKKKAIKQLNRQMAMEKGYMSLPAGKKLLRFIKETGKFKYFISLVRKKHHIGFQAAIDCIKSNPDIYYLIGTFSAVWSGGSFGSQTTSFMQYDSITERFIDEFNKFRPIC